MLYNVLWDLLEKLQTKMREKIVKMLQNITVILIPAREFSNFFEQGNSLCVYFLKTVVMEAPLVTEWVDV